MTLADAKGLVTFDRHGMITDVADWDDQDVKIVHVIGHDRKTRDATDLLYRALLALGYADRNPCPKERKTKTEERRQAVERKLKAFATIDFEASGRSIAADVVIARPAESELSLER